MGGVGRALPARLAENRDIDGDKGAAGCAPCQAQQMVYAVSTNQHSTIHKGVPNNDNQQLPALKLDNFTVKMQSGILSNDRVFVRGSLTVRCDISTDIIPKGLVFSVRCPAQARIPHKCDKVVSYYTLETMADGNALIFTFPDKFYFNGFNVINERRVFDDQPADLNHALKAALVHDVLITYQQMFGNIKWGIGVGNTLNNLNLRQLADFLFEQLLKKDDFCLVNRYNLEIAMIVGAVKFNTTRLRVKASAPFFGGKRRTPRKLPLW
ncbi:hypothetical protein J8273_1908 [Carpediemonas membranifera]|uniref:Uncharacterized protein n=1 Tax=Carpediemonas membranifera TaxID=201153 RepID=A0A8J6C0R5_9EUKA|nr:hypothetical protein J8273_1908 [Carpediemonas membranifera]|eukprot:KAG9396861.1 hypothetical protein J8273_1908 [Carpediemonas membranifera]